jgi:phosphotransferase system  glucose/maltose/N-acetylglucosamine-specific IIC component
MMETLGMAGILLRLAMTLLLVLATYNPSGYSYLHWAMRQATAPTPSLALAGLLLLIGWIVFLRATLKAIGWGGSLLVAAVLGALVWLVVSWGWLDPHNAQAMGWVLLIALAVLLAVGLCWSHLRRRLTGQADVEEVEEPR